MAATTDSNTKSTASDRTGTKARANDSTAKAPTVKPAAKKATASPASAKSAPARTPSAATKTAVKTPVPKKPAGKPAASTTASTPSTARNQKVVADPSAPIAEISAHSGAAITTDNAVPSAATVKTPEEAVAPKGNDSPACSVSLPAESAEFADKPDSATDIAPELNDAAEDDTLEEDSDFDEMRNELMLLQQQIRAAQIPVVIVFEGWDAAGKGTMLSKLVEGLDPRGYQVYPTRKSSENDKQYPSMRRYWVHMPAAGNISLFCSSWYREVSNACFETKSARKHLNQRYDDIVNLESQLVTDGVLLIKFFLHISRKEQKRRFKALESKKNTRWLVDQADWEQNEHYEEYLRLYDAMIARTHLEGALWHVLRSDNKRLCIRQVYGIVIEAFQAALRDRAANLRAWDTPFLPHLEIIPSITMPPLESFDPEQVLTEPYKPAVDAAQKRLRKLQNELYQQGISMVVCFEGWDAAGKGGAIRRLTSSLDARGFDVVPISAPTALEKSHHYLWRFWRELPKNGQIAIFDRTWYGRVMVERIEGFCTEPQWQRAYEEINRFEANIKDHHTIICKFWLQIDSDTQLARFNDRQNTIDKQWKITPEDWRNREKWPLYETAVAEMLQKTNSAAAPWTVVESNNKQFARLKVLETVIDAIEKQLGCKQD